MNRLRNVLLAGLVWCGVVTVVATLVWVVISRAGEGVAPLTPPEADGTASLPVPADTSSPAVRRTPAGGGGPRAHPTPTPPTSRPTVSGAPTDDATGAVSSSPSASSSRSAGPSSSPTGGGTPAPTVQRRSWSGAAGHVVVECRGPSATLVSAFPNADWRYRIGSRGPTLVQVRFTRITGDDDSVLVSARCGSGVPHFSLRGGDD